jgi:hypothetical protein
MISLMEPRLEYIVLYSPGWPGGYMPVPNTEYQALKFSKEHGGVVKVRLTSEWVELSEI